MHVDEPGLGANFPSIQGVHEDALVVVENVPVGQVSHIPVTLFFFCPGWHVSGQERNFESPPCFRT